jgi:hypothetical protein
VPTNPTRPTQRQLTQSPTMATITTVHAALRRQWHVCTSQRAVHSSLCKRCVISDQRSNQNNYLILNWPQQRYLSDQFRPRAIGAFKSKRHTVPDGPTVPDESKRNDDAAATTDKKSNSDDPTPVSSTASGATPADTDKAVGLFHELPTESTTSSKTSTDISSDDREKNDSNQLIAEQSNNTNTADSNPWAHMHLHEFAPKIVVIGVGGAGTNAVNNMVSSRLAGTP